MPKTKWPWPAEKQQAFWKACGFTQVKGRYYAWVFPDKTIASLPPIDLNSLFRWAVPTQDYVTLYFQGNNATEKYKASIFGWRSEITYSAQDPTEALANALYEALVERKGEADA